MKDISTIEKILKYCLWGVYIPILLGWLIAIMIFITAYIDSELDLLDGLLDIVVIMYLIIPIFFLLSILLLIASIVVDVSNSRKEKKAKHGKWRWSFWSIALVVLSILLWGIITGGEFSTTGIDETCLDCEIEFTRPFPPTI